MKNGNDGGKKSYRMLAIYSELQQRMVLQKSVLAQAFGISERTIQRDIGSLRNFLAEQRLPWEIVLDRHAGGYRLSTIASAGLSSGEALTVCKILLESRSLRRDEMMRILYNLLYFFFINFYIKLFMFCNTYKIVIIYFLAYKI